MDYILLGAIKLWAQALAVVFIVVSVMLIVLVLLQKGKGGGLSSAFGGAGGQSAFGSKTGDVFTWITIVVVGSFLLLAMIVTMNYEPYIEVDEALSAGMLDAAPGSPGVAPETSDGALPDTTQTQPVPDENDQPGPADATTEAPASPDGKTPAD